MGRGQAVESLAGPTNSEHLGVVWFVNNMLNAFSLRNSSHQSSNKQANLPKSYGLQTRQTLLINLLPMQVNINPWKTFQIICTCPFFALFCPILPSRL